MKKINYECSYVSHSLSCVAYISPPLNSTIACMHAWTFLHLDFSPDPRPTSLSPVQLTLNAHVCSFKNINSPPDIEHIFHLLSAATPRSHSHIRLRDSLCDAMHDVVEVRKSVLIYIFSFFLWGIFPHFTLLRTHSQGEFGIPFSIFPHMHDWIFY